MSDPSAQSADGQRPYVQYVSDQLTAEHARRLYLDSRGAGVVTVSGTFIGAVFALAAFVLGDSYRPSVPGGLLVAVALVLLSISSALGIFATLPRSYGVPDVKSLREMASTRWNDDSREALRQVTLDKVASVEKLRAKNKQKAIATFAATVLQAGALMVLAAALLTELLSTIY